MNHRALGSIAVAAAIAFARPVAFLAQDAGKAAEILAATRKAIGEKKLDTLETFSVQSAVQRNVGSMQMNADVEILLDLPDKYVRSEVMNGGGNMMVRGGGTTGFNGDAPIRMADAALKAQYAYAGEAESPDGKAYVIDVKGADNFAARLFIDEQTHLPLMVTYKAPQPRVVQMNRGERRGADLQKQMKDLQNQPPPPMADYTLYFDDWRDADGVKFPFKMRRAAAGDTTEEWTIDKVKVNPKIDPKR